MTLDAGIGANSASGGYEIENSSVWEPDLADQAYRSQGSTAGTRTKQTFSVWLKRTELGGDQYIFEGGTGNANDTQFGIQFSNSNKIQVMRGHTSGGYQYLLNTNRLFRDTSAWMHIVVAVDTTLGTADNRVRLYVNGVEETSFANRNNPSQNDNLGTFAANAQTSLGVSANLGKHIAAYIAHPALVYNAQLPPTDFGEFDEVSGIWKPIDLSDVTFGTYGYWLKNETYNQMYNDSSGNSNNFARWDSTIYQTTDTPTNNFCTLNPLYGMTYPLAISDGGTKSVADDSVAQWQSAKGSMAVNNGKWYWEYSGFSTLSTFLGIQSANANGVYNTAYAWNLPLNDNSFYIADPNGRTEGFTTTKATTDVWAIALNMDDGEISFYRNGTQQNSTVSIDGLIGNGPYVAIISQYASATNASTNFGGYNSGKAISSAATDENGYGTFEYAPPSGYYALCTKNLAEYGG